MDGQWLLDTRLRLTEWVQLASGINAVSAYEGYKLIKDKDEVILAVRTRCHIGKGVLFVPSLSWADAWRGDPGAKPHGDEGVRWPSRTCRDESSTVLIGIGQGP